MISVIYHLLDTAYILIERDDQIPSTKLKFVKGGKRKKTSTQNTSTGGQRPRPDATDTQAVQNYFLQEIHTGEEKLALGMIDAGVEHLYNAVSICAQPQQLLQVLQQTLPPNIFQQLINKLQSVATSKVSKEPIAEQVDDELE
ncbi:TOMM20 [Bugula neritina]|uniref:TOMM20 n=1 Tax=Bugula neritina TaxID=10212 RepID=A0A7J7JD25_BUGNE|nr:TOMM20 [Bugula neritina]